MRARDEGAKAREISGNWGEVFWKLSMKTYKRDAYIPLSCRAIYVLLRLRPYFDTRSGKEHFRAISAAYPWLPAGLAGVQLHFYTGHPLLQKEVQSKKKTDVSLL